MADGDHGALILDVAPYGEAQIAGLAPGDIVAAVDGLPVGGVDDLKERIRNSRPYTPVTIVVRRFGSRLEKKLLPIGVLRIAVKETERNFRSFKIPGVPQANIEQPATALDALENINVLESVIIDRKTGQIVMMGKYDPKYATGPIPYLDLLKTALMYPEPRLSLDDAMDAGEFRKIRERKYLHHVPWDQALLAMPQAERERQQLIREMAASYGITPDEYVSLYNYGYLDTNGSIAPKDVGRIVAKTLRHVGQEGVANAYEQLEKDTTDSLAEALKILGREAAAQKIIADKNDERQNTDRRLRALACVSIMERLSVSPNGMIAAAKDFAEWILEARRGEIKSVGADQALNRMYRFFPLEIHASNGDSIQRINLAKILIGDAPAKLLTNATEALYYIPIRTTGLDRNSRLARIFYEADYSLKAVETRPEFFSAVPGHTTHFRFMRSRRAEINPNARAKDFFRVQRLTLEPKRTEISVSPDGNVLSFDRAEMTLATGRMQGRGQTVKLSAEQEAEEKKIDKIYEDWAAHFDVNYDLYAQAVPPFHSLREAEKIIALAKWLNERHITVRLDNVEQERWKPPENVTGLFFFELVYSFTASGVLESLTPMTYSGGVSFNKSNWTSYGSASKTSETKVPDQLVLSSQLGKTAVGAATTGDLEKARYYSELSAQALAGHVTRGELAKQNVILPEARIKSVSPAQVQLQRQLLKETSDQILALKQNPSDAQAAAGLVRINKIYDQVQSRPGVASDYVVKPQTHRPMSAESKKPTSSEQAPAGGKPGEYKGSDIEDVIRSLPQTKSKKAAYDCSTCNDALRQTIQAKLAFDPDMLPTWVDAAIAKYNNCKLSAGGSCKEGDVFVTRLRSCDYLRGTDPHETSYYVCINQLFYQ